MIIVTVFVVLGTLVAVASIQAHLRHRTGQAWPTPLDLFTLGWVASLTAAMLVPFNMLRPSPFSFGLMLLAYAGFYFGEHLLPRPTGASTSQAGADSRQVWVLKATTALLLGIGLPLLASYAPDVVRAGAAGPQELAGVRSALRGDATPIGFYFFYFLEPVPPIAAVIWRLEGRRFWLLVAILAGLSLLLTTGRINFVKSVTWAALATVVLAPHYPVRTRRRGARRRSHPAALATAAVLSLLAFVWVGTLVGKTAQNHEVVRSIGHPLTDTEATAVVPLYYLAGPPVALGERVASSTPDGLSPGGRTIGPLLEAINAVGLGDLTSAPNLDEFEYIPYRINVFTAVYPVYSDFGATGVVVVFALWGWAGAVAMARAQAGSVAAALSASLLGVAALLAFFDFQLDKPSWWFNFALVGGIGLLARKHLQTKEPR